MVWTKSFSSGGASRGSRGKGASSQRRANRSVSASGCPLWEAQDRSRVMSSGVSTASGSRPGARRKDGSQAAEGLKQPGYRRLVGLAEWYFRKPLEAESDAGCPG